MGGQTGIKDDLRIFQAFSNSSINYLITRIGDSDYLIVIWCVPDAVAKVSFLPQRL